MSVRESEQWAKRLLKKGEQPLDIAMKTGLDITWIELQARKLGLKEMTKAVRIG